MVNNIIDGIVIKIDQIFGVDSIIYTKSVEQDFKEPCFYVKLLRANYKQILNKRYYMEHTFDVHYFPGTTDKNTEMYNTALKLTGLEYITSDGHLIRGTKMKYEIVDNVLHFYVQYNYFVYLTQEEVDKMQTLSVHNGIGG